MESKLGKKELLMIDDDEEEPVQQPAQQPGQQPAQQSGQQLKHLHKHKKHHRHARKYINMEKRIRLYKQRLLTMDKYEKEKRNKFGIYYKASSQYSKALINMAKKNMKLKQDP